MKKRQKKASDAFSMKDAVELKASARGSDFDEFLADERILAEVEATSFKRVFAYQLQKAMK